MATIYVVTETKEHEYGQKTSVNLYSTLLAANRAARKDAKQLQYDLDTYSRQALAPIDDEMDDGMYSAAVEIEDGQMAYIAVSRKTVLGPDVTKGEVDGEEEEIDEEEDGDEQEVKVKEAVVGEKVREATLAEGTSRDSSIEILEPATKRAKVD